jgi:hypothetical protein
MSDWVAAEGAACHLPEVRHTTRLARLFARLSARPVGRLPTACHGGAETVATARFLSHPPRDAQASVSGHTHATRERLRAQASVWLVPATPWLPDGTTPPKAGLGTGKITTREESRLPPPVVLPPERLT